MVSTHHFIQKPLGHWRRFGCQVQRLLTQLLIITLLAASLPVKAGDTQQVTLHLKNEPLVKVFEEIKKQTGYLFFYENKLLKNARPVDIQVSNASLEEVLRISFRDQPLSYEIVGKTIVVKAKAENPSPSLSSPIPAPPPPIDIKGRVVNENGEPVVVTVTVKGTKNATSTNANGEFELKGVDDNATLVITGVNVEMVEWKVNGKTELLLTAKTRITEGEAVVLHTGYQDIPKERSTGSFYKIDNELLNRKVSTKVLDRIFDVSSGLIYTKTAGGGTLSAIGSDGLPALQIRGASTIQANKLPLVVIDNFPYMGVSLDNLNINPNDIESITLLKDAAAASIWGIQAGNGVIVITTKKGSFNQKAKISINSNITIGNKPDLFYIPIISSTDVIAFEKQRFADSVYNIFDDLGPTFGIFPVYSQVIELLLATRKGKISKAEADAAIAELQAHDVRNDINRYLLQNSINQQYALNISGGSANYQYYGSVGYDANRPVEVGNTDTRLTLRMSSVWKPVKKLELSGEINYLQGNTNSQGNNYSGLLALGGGRPPYTRLADENGNALAIPQSYRLAYVDTAKHPGLLDWHYRPLDELRMKYNTTQSITNDIRLLTGLKYEVIKGVTISMQYQVQKTLFNSTDIHKQGSFVVRDGINRFMNIVGGQITYPWPLGSILGLSTAQFNSWNLRTQLNFDKSWADNHRISALLGSEINERKQSFWSNQVIGFDEETSLAPVVDYLKLYPARPGNSQRAIGQSSPRISLDDNLYRNGNYFANAGYSYKKRYLLTVSARIDQANLFGVKANQRRVPLWSGGLGWIVSDEYFYNLSWLSQLKLRASYGYNGNASTTASAFPTIRYTNGDGIYIPAPVFSYILSPNNPQLRWEKVKMINLGIDFAIFNDRIGGSIEYYHKKGIDLLGQLPTDPTSGWSSYFANFASIKAGGWDIVINTQNFNKRFGWNTNFQISFNTDKVTDYSGQSGLLASNLVSGFPVQIGKTLYALNSYRFAGLRTDNGTPQIYLADTISSFNNFSQGGPSDVVYHGSRSPRIFGNIINTFTWGNLSVSCNITYKLKYFFRRSSYAGQINGGNLGGHADYSFRWQKPGDEKTTNVPANGNDNRYLVYGFSDVLVEKGDHIRLQDFRISFDINRSVIKKLPFQNVQVYFYANNLGIIWRANARNIDPEAYLFGNTPAPRTFSFGVTVDY